MSPSSEATVPEEETEVNPKEAERLAIEKARAYKPPRSTSTASFASSEYSEVSANARDSDASDDDDNKQDD